MSGWVSVGEDVGVDRCVRVRPYASAYASAGESPIVEGFPHS